MKSVSVRFPCGSLTLEGELGLPEGSGPFPSVIIGHPHPLYGGNMLNNVVSAIWQALPEHSMAAFRFNFRGVGGSSGAFGGGISEREDVRAALAFVLSRPEIDPKRTGLAGYSFGAGVVLPVAVGDERVQLFALVSAQLSYPVWETLKGCSKRALLLVGSADAFVTLDEFEQRVKGMAGPAEYQVIPGADHFWWGYEAEVARRVGDFFATGFRER